MTTASVEAKSRAGQPRGESRVIEAGANSLLVRLAESQDEIDAALALRYRVFYEEMHAKPTPEMEARHQDFDRYDDLFKEIQKAIKGYGGRINYLEAQVKKLSK